MSAALSGREFLNQYLLRNGKTALEATREDWAQEAALTDAAMREGWAQEAALARKAASPAPRGPGRPLGSKNRSK